VERSPFVTARVDEWSNEGGWGVLHSDEVPEGIWVHFSAVAVDGYKTLRVGEVVEAEVEGPLPFDQDGYRYRARRVRPLHY
jgi:cold shock CspA family protein